MNVEKLPEWNNYSNETVGEVKRDKKERPPLTGKKRYIPNGLYDEPWDKVGDAYGKATLTPYYIEGITSDDPDDVNFATYGLYSATTHQGSVYKASKMAVPFLADLLTLDNDASDIACHFLARIALGEAHFIRTPAYFFKTKYYGAVKKQSQAILDYYHRTGSLEAMRLLCFIPKMLPDQLNLSDENPLRQASTLLVQGFIAAERNYLGKGYPTYVSEIAQEPLKVCCHVEETRKLMQESPSLLVRGCAAICLAFTGCADKEVMDLLGWLGSQNFNRVDWPWDENFSSIAKKAWMFAVDTETLAETDLFPTLDYTSTTKERVVTKHYSQSEILTEALARVFPYKYDENKNAYPSLKPAELNELQRKILYRMLEAAPGLFGSYTIAGMNLPIAIEGARRMLNDSDEALCAEIDGLPLWYVLERAVIENEPEKAMDALKKVDTWQVINEIYHSWGLSGERERNTLNLSHYNEKVMKEREALLQSILADSLLDIKEAKSFLDECIKIRERFLEDDKWIHRIKAQKTGICLLALARNKQLNEKYVPLVRPFHSYAEYSEFPAVLVREVLEQTSPEHQEAIKEQFRL